MLEWYNAKSNDKEKTLETITTVNAAMWENSVRAAFSLWADIIKPGGRTDWKEQEFKDALSNLCPDYHSTVLSLAWSLLPGNYKHGPGRPKKPVKTSNTSK